MPYSLEDIRKQRQKYDDAGYPREHVRVEDVTFMFYVLPRKMGGELSLFAQRMTPTLKELRENRIADCTLFAVSDAIPEQFRPFIAAHEILEYCSLPLQDPSSLSIAETDTIADGCRSASEAEWAMVLESFHPNVAVQYAGMRCQFFEELVAYAEKRPGAFKQPSVANFQSSAMYWQDPH